MPAPPDAMVEREPHPEFPCSHSCPLHGELWRRAVGTDPAPAGPGRVQRSVDEVLAKRARTLELARSYLDDDRVGSARRTLDHHADLSLILTHLTGDPEWINRP